MIASVAPAVVDSESLRMLLPGISGLMNALIPVAASANFESRKLWRMESRHTRSGDILDSGVAVCDWSA